MILVRCTSNESCGQRLRWRLALQLAKEQLDNDDDVAAARLAKLLFHDPQAELEHFIARLTCLDFLHQAILSVHDESELSLPFLYLLHSDLSIHFSKGRKRMLYKDGCQHLKVDGPILVAGLGIEVGQLPIATFGSNGLGKSAIFCGKDDALRLREQAKFLLNIR